MGTPLKYPLIKQHSQTGKFQPVPVWQGQRTLLPLDFPQQGEAFFAAKVFLEIMGDLAPDIEVRPALSPERMKEVKDVITEYIKKSRLEPTPRPMVKETPKGAKS